MSKAFLRSKKTTALTKPRSTFKDQLSVASINAVTVEWSVAPCYDDKELIDDEIVCRNDAVVEGYKIHVYSNHTETIIKYFVTNLNNHKTLNRSRHLVY